MIQPHCGPNPEQVVDTMIELTRLSNLHRAIIAGTDSLELYLALRRRGFIRVATTATCHIPRRQHAIGLITSQSSLRAVEAALAQISQFLCESAAIAVLIDSRESGFCLKVRTKLEQMGFRIEAGVRCQQGLVLSAYRQGFGQMENAACNRAAAVPDLSNERGGQLDAPAGRPPRGLVNQTLIAARCRR